MKRMLLIGLGSIALLGNASTQVLAQSQDSDAAYFENKIRPLLAKNCLECHGQHKQEGELRLDTEAGLKKGGESGKILDLEDHSKSLILEAVRYEGLEMPPNGKLPEESIELLTEWVRRGAVWPQHAAPIVVNKGPRVFTDSEKAYWFYQPHRKFAPPRKGTIGTNASEVQHPIDAFVSEQQSKHDLAMAPEADRRTLGRRAFLDLLGVPPSWSELQTYVEDRSTDAYEKLIDRLLDDPRYGQRWGRYWLDLVRYAESDGYKQDDFRPTAYRYRDYVVRSFNEDKPYAKFITEQLAGDELVSDKGSVPSQDALDATGYLRLWIYEYNQRDVEGQRSAILNDLTDVTGDVFLGMSYGCARCHDHKFDPLLQKDYYRLQAFFTGIIPRDDFPILTDEEKGKMQAKLAAWEEKTKEIRAKIDELEKPTRDRTVSNAIEKFPPEVRPALLKTEEERSPREKQIAHLAFLQIKNELKGLDFKKKFKDQTLKDWTELSDQLEQHKSDKPKSPPTWMTVTDVGRIPADSVIPGKANEPVLPGAPSIVSPDPMVVSPLEKIESSGRRLALANWMADPSNPFTWRVVVNRVWQHHFGKGLVENASDFGKLTQPPSHPELLDWMANWFIEHDGSLKQLHRLMMTSNAYKQAAYPASLAKSSEIDPDNKWLWRFAARRLDAEQIRDSMLVVSGDIDPIVGGPSVNADSFRRSIYRKAMRNAPDPILARFDAPDGSSPTAKRATTTTSIQALMLINSDWILERASRMATKVQSESSDMNQQVEAIYKRVFGRIPTESEKTMAHDFLTVDGSLSDLCHAILNSNEFFFWE